MYRYYIKDHGRRRIVEYPVKEATQLAELIGFDFERETQFRWFLNQALNTLLPIGWKRESDPFGNVHYHNEKTQVTTKNNPLVYKFRKCFERLLLREMEQPSDAEKPGESKSGKSQLIAISSLEEQEAVFKNLMEKGAHNELNFSEKFLEIMKEAEEFYEAIFVDESFKPPKSIAESIEFLLVNPEEMADLARDYKIILEPQLIWIARAALVLPLPPLWRSEINALGEKVYINSEINNPQTEAPFHAFLNKYIQKARLVLPQEGEKFMTFYDKDCVKYVVDLTKLPTKRDYKVLKDDKPDPDLLKKALYFKPQLSSEEALTDVMIFEIAQSVGIDMNRELHLISAVYQIIETIKSKNILKNWDFRITMEGTKYWYNTKDKRSIPDFPYKDEIKKYVRVVRKEAISNAKTSIKKFSERHPEFQVYGKEFYERCKKEAMAVTESLVKKHLSINESFSASGLVKAHLKRKDNLQEYLDLVFANPFDFGIDSVKDSLDPSHMSIDMPAEFNETKRLQKITEDQVETLIKEKEKAVSEARNDSTFVRSDRDRRKTIVVESIPSESPTKPDFRRFKTIGQEDGGVIAEIDSSEEDSRSEPPAAEESEDNEEYLELQQLVEEKIEHPKAASKLSSIRMAVSRKNTIESIIIKERRQSNNDFHRSSSELSALQSEDSPDYRDIPARTFDRTSNFKGTSQDLHKFEEENRIYQESQGKAHQDFKSKPRNLKRTSEKITSPKSQDLQEDHLKPRHSADVFERLSPRTSRKNEFLTEQLKAPSQARQDSNSIDRLSESIKSPEASSEAEPFRELDRKVSLISGYDENLKRPEELKRTDTKKSPRFKDESLSDQMDFSSIASKSDQQSLFEDDLAEIEIDKRHEERFKLESENSSVSRSLRKKIVSQKSLKSVIMFEDDKIKINPRLAAPDPFDDFKEVTRGTDGLPARKITQAETLKMSGTRHELLRKSTSPEMLNKFDWVAANMHRGIIYETVKTEQAAYIRSSSKLIESSDKIVVKLPSKRNTVTASPLPAQSARLNPHASTLKHFPREDLNLDDQEKIKTLKYLESKAELSDLEDSSAFHEKKDGKKEKPAPVSNEVLLENLETQKKIFEEVFSPLSKKPLKSPILLPKIVNLDVFGAHIMRIPRRNNEPELVSPRPRRLDPLDDKKPINHSHRPAEIEKTLQVSPRLHIQKTQILENSQSLPEIKPKIKKKLKVNKESLALQEKLLFMYYLELIGHPSCSRSSLNFFYVARHVQPVDVLNMAKRLGLRVSPSPYSSFDSDLVWIAYLQIATPMPTGFNSHTRVSTMLTWPLGKHPGDVYFTLLVKCQRRNRNNELKKLGKMQKVENLISFSWCRFLNEKNKNFYFNFLTGVRSEAAPQISENFDVAVGVKKKNRLKEVLSHDQDIQDIISKYDIENKGKDERFYNLSNYIIQTLISNESLDEELKFSEGSSET